MIGRILFFIMIIALLVVSAAFTDDASWSSSFRISGGGIYSEEEEQSIVLEKELLIFTGRTTEAHFLFRNISDRDIELDCGFPVVHRIEINLLEGRAEIPINSYGDNEIPALDFFETRPYSTDENIDYFDVYPEIIPDNEVNNSREFIGAEIPEAAGIDFFISQDDQGVQIEDILLERSIKPDFAGLTFHFKHKLRFPASETTIVSVKYSQDLLYGNAGGAACDIFKWDYVIGTGGTWLGPIGELYFIKPSAWKGSLPGLKSITDDRGIEIYYAEKWEPSLDEEFSLVSTPISIDEEFSFYSDIAVIKELWNDGLSQLDLPEAPAQDFVSKVDASSALSDEIQVFLENGLVADSGFSAISAFDGFEETSWSEAAAGPGAGEYLVAELSEDVYGLIIRNGFKRLPLDDWVYDTGIFERRVKDGSSGFKDYYTMNNRVRLLDLLDSNGTLVAHLELEDRRDPQIFFGLHLEPGLYRFVVKDVYEGTSWADTCLAEITFIPGPDGPLADSLFSGEFYRSVLGIRMYQ